MQKKNWHCLGYFSSTRYIDSWTNEQTDDRSTTRKFRDVKLRELAGCLELWLPGGPHPSRSNNICIITLSQHRLLLALVTSPKTPQCIPVPAVSPLLLLVLLSFLLSTMHNSSLSPTLVLTCIGLGVIISPMLSKGTTARKARKKERIVWGEKPALLPLVPIPVAQLWLGLQAFRQALTSCFWGCLWMDTEEA